MFDVSISTLENKVLSKLIVDSYFFEPSKYEYAFYLYQNGKRIHAKQYTNSMEAYFPIEETTGIFYIRAFIRDIEHRNIRGFNSEKISIDS